MVPDHGELTVGFNCIEESSREQWRSEWISLGDGIPTWIFIT
jgi:hypothetical protein